MSSFSSPPRLLLASSSPRRSQLLASVGVPFQVVPSPFDEPDPTPEDEQNPAAYVERLARGKAAAARADVLELSPLPAPGVLILAADTTVWREGRILNKPRDEDEARAMLRALRGGEHRVYTGVCLRRLHADATGSLSEAYLLRHEATTVRFRTISDAWIDGYVAGGEPMDKAGAYAAQGMGAILIERVEGDFSNVVGLPLCLLARMMEELGAPIEEYWS